MSGEKKPLDQLVEQIVAAVKRFAEENGGLTWYQVEVLLGSRYGLLGRRLWDLKIRFL